ncbi:MAG: ATPase protein [Proteobacteria bacterium]|nr:ATPase protein [Pseudomonadota bacterium]
MKLLYIHIEEDYKHIKAGGYYFDKEFNVINFNTTPGQRKITLETNPNYHRPFNQNINNISCIVGKNGVGKTTFFELIIAPLLWRLDGPLLENKIHLLYYDEIEKEFYIQSYTGQANNWGLYLDGHKIHLFKNKKNNSTKINVESGSTYRSVFPYQMNIIFHSLSPFDRIYDLLKLQLSDASYGQIEHYRKRLKYIGTRQIENNETIYEYMTLINLISILLDNNSKEMFSKLGYEYGNIEINIVNEEDELTINIPEFTSFKDESKKMLEVFFTEESYMELKEKLSFYLIADSINGDFFKELLLKSVKIDTPKRFLNFLSIIAEENQNTISLETIMEAIYQYLLNLNFPEQIKELCTSENYKFLTEIFENKKELLTIDQFSDSEYLKERVNSPEFLKLLKFIKKLAIRNLINFKMYLLKKGESFDYFRLSSGEKTLLSYFANILGRIRELDDIQAENATYSSIQNKSYLILIDEVELHLHPEWQRNFIKQLNEFFTYFDKSKKFQFVIASHSPFIVTDIYDENIIYLGENNPNTKTFGGNIFDIFKDDFYVSNTIGSFSEGIIKDLSEIIYILFAIQKALNEGNFFILREYLDLMYETSEREEENRKLLEELVTFLQVKNNSKFSKLSTNRFLPLKGDFMHEFNKIKNNIGEEVVREHFDKMLNYIRESHA